MTAVHNEDRSDTPNFDDGIIELPNKYDRRSVLQLLLVLNIIFGTFFSVLNWNTHESLAIVEITFSVYLLILLFFARVDQYQFRVSLLFLIPMYSVMLWIIESPNSSETVFAWILVIPILSHLLLGRWFGLIISLIFMSLGLYLFTLRFYVNDSVFNLIETCNVIIAGATALIFSHIYEVSRTRAHQKLLHLATTDSLTALANRTRFLDVFERERNHALRNNSDLSLLLLDIDHFKHVNDNYGHDVGDEVLKYVSAKISHRLRKTDLACRLGGEEFGVLLPGANLDSAISIAETIRKNIADAPYSRGETMISLSISIGVAEYGFDGRDLESLYAVADGHLYRAKTSGRNSIRSRQVMTDGELNLVLTD
ncbi:MAG: diguanylate cyclase (GGDEF)-like protein [Oleispira sp.]|jgi:diguanylate cyclase (GGDEF)-like protein